MEIWESPEHRWELKPREQMRSAGIRYRERDKGRALSDAGIEGGAAERETIELGVGGGTK